MIDLNDRSPGYEPDEITWLLQPAGSTGLPPLFQGLRIRAILSESVQEQRFDGRQSADPKRRDGFARPGY